MIVFQVLQLQSFTTSSTQGISMASPVSGQELTSAKHHHATAASNTQGTPKVGDSSEAGHGLLEINVRLFCRLTRHLLDCIFCRNPAEMHPNNTIWVLI